jgi:hypothetical protein
VNITPSHAKRLNFPLKACVLGSLLLCTALGSSALTIGRMRGTAWLGQPLDVTIQVQYDEAESLSALCFDAEVFHADTRQDPARVRVRVEGATQAQTAQVRVQSSVGVDEPVVSVYLRESCVSKSSRRYVLLTELAGETVSSVALAAQPTPSRTAVEPVAPKRAPVVAPRPVAPAPVKPVAVKPVAVKPAAEPAKAQPETARSKPAVSVASHKPPEPPRAKVASEPAGKSQLKLDPLSSLSERVAQLEDVTMASQAADGDREALRLKKMEENVQALMALSAKNDRSMAELRARLQAAEAEKYDNPLVYGLAAMLLAALGATAFMWRRLQEGGRLRESNDWLGRLRPAPRMPEASMPLAAVTPSPSPAPELAPVPDTLVAATPRAVVEASPAPAPQPEAGSDVDLDDLMAAIMPESEPLPRSDAVPSDTPDFPVLTAATQHEEADEQAEPAGYHEFPAAGEVHIDVSHLSLTPVEPAAPSTPSEVLLDFDFPEFEKKDASEGELKKDAPTSAGG